MEDSQKIRNIFDEPEYPEVSFPIPHSDRVSSMIDILPTFSDEEIEGDDKLAHILKMNQRIRSGFKDNSDDADGYGDLV